MKNVQIVDGADNATFAVFQATDEEFRLIFPPPGQDLEIPEALFRRELYRRARAENAKRLRRRAPHAAGN
jgi:NADPH-dependent ferric siderophore reductase